MLEIKISNSWYILNVCFCHEFSRSLLIHQYEKQIAGGVKGGYLQSRSNKLMLSNLILIFGSRFNWGKKKKVGLSCHKGQPNPISNWLSSRVKLMINRYHIEKMLWIMILFELNDFLNNIKVTYVILI